MDGLTASIKRCNLQLKLDNNTEGYGNCFPNAIVQQCRRPEIRAWLQENRPLGIVNGQRTLRTKVTNFAVKSRHIAILDYKATFFEATYEADRRLWSDYWNEMRQDGTWVDSTFVQLTAWYMGLDILILDTSAKPENPFIKISGNISNTAASSSGPPLLVGNYTNVHYQSLLPFSPNLSAQLVQQPKCSMVPAKTTEGKKESDDNAKPDDFIYVHNGDQIIFNNLESGKLQCPFCSESFLRIVSHITSKKCKIVKSNIDIKEFKSQLDSFKEGFRLASGRKRKQKSQQN